MHKIGRCVHFNGIQNDVCNAGVNYKALASTEPGMFRRLPCFRNEESTLVCDKRREPTAEEIAKDERWLQERMDRMPSVK